MGRVRTKAERKAKLLSFAGTAAAGGFVVLAFWLFGRILHRYDLGEIVSSLGRIPASRLAGAAAGIALCYGAQTVYDFLAARSAGIAVSYPRAALAAFVGNSFTNNIGFSLLTGTSIRYRYYLAWGFGALPIAELIALTKLAFFGGLLLATGLAQILVPVEVESLPIKLSPRLIGAILLLPPAALMIWNGLAPGKTLALGKFRLQRPKPGMLALQFAAASTQFAFAGMALYFLLPAADLRQAGFAGPVGFMGAFMAIKFASLFLPVPGSLGVLEAAAMAVLTPALPAYPVLGALLAFRAGFYLAPFGIGLAVMSGYELVSGKGLLPSLIRRRRESRRP